MAPANTKASNQQEQYQAASDLQSAIQRFCADPAATTEAVLAALYRLRSAKLAQPGT